ncbi:MAG: phosphotransferase family protein [Pseudomonadota bacterium]|nr:phosphotransferase family protein [Pseudomonadota bacterium]
MNDLDMGALERWLEVKLPSEQGLSVERIGGGQSNPTWFVDFGKARLVLRKKPAGPILKGAHAIEREFRVLRALDASPVPVPRALWLEEDTAHLGTPFYVMERLEGRVFNDNGIAGVSPADRREMYLDTARTLARLHAVRPDEVGLGDFGRPGSYFERQFKRWSDQYAQSPSPRIPALDKLVEWLPANMPPEDGAVSIAHGDFRIGNLMFHPTEPRVIAVLDWELATLGHPLADLGYALMPWRTSPQEYGGILGADWQSAGIPTEDEFVAEYMAHAHAPLTLTRFHVAFALFRFSVIFVGIADRARAGTASSEDASAHGDLPELFARRALEAAGLA